MYVAVWAIFLFLKGTWRVGLLKSFLCQVYTGLCSHISAFEEAIFVTEVGLHMRAFAGSSQGFCDHCRQ